MNYKNTILLSIGVGVFCGIFGGLPILKDSSFTDMAGGYEFWVFTAVIICVNSKKFYEAGIKCFLYFLITQPLQFFIQALLYSHDLSKALYFSKLWLPIIILTLPGGMIAYFSKKENVFGSIILGLGNTIEGISFISYLNAFLNNAPRHILSTIFSISSIFIMTFALKKRKSNQSIALTIPCILCIALVIYAKINGLTI